MTSEARIAEDYSPRQTEAARRVLIDLGQILASFADCLVVVGGWVPDLLLPEAIEPHAGSMDVDIALDAERLMDGRYAELLALLFETGRYQHGMKPFQIVTRVDLGDEDDPIEVDVEFLAPDDVELAKHTPKLVENFRVLRVPSVRDAFRDPVSVTLHGRNARGAKNSITLRVVPLSDFLVMKAHAIGGRDKPKDSYDLCYCLDHFPGEMEALAAEWKQHDGEQTVQIAIGILREKFADVDTFGPQQVAEFHASVDSEIQAMHARRAYELVQKFINFL